MHTKHTINVKMVVLEWISETINRFQLSLRKLVRTNQEYKQTLGSSDIWGIEQ